MEKLERYIEAITKDLYIDDFNIKEVQMRLPARKHYWVAKLIDAKIQKGKLVAQKLSLKESLIPGIIEGSSIRLTANSAAHAADKHETVQAINKSIRELEFIIEYLEKTEKIFASTGFDIKNIIAINQMEQL